MTQDEFEAIVAEEDALDYGIRTNWDNNFPFDRLNSRKDIHAFILLDQIVARAGAPEESGDIVTGADHDVIYLDVRFELIFDHATPDEVKQLNACGIIFDRDNDSFYMFV